MRKGKRRENKKKERKIDNKTRKIKRARRSKNK